MITATTTTTSAKLCKWASYIITTTTTIICLCCLVGACWKERERENERKTYHIPFQINEWLDRFYVYAHFVYQAIDSISLVRHYSRVSCIIGGNVVVHYHKLVLHLLLIRASARTANGNFACSQTCFIGVIFWLPFSVIIIISCCCL